MENRLSQNELRFEPKWRRGVDRWAGQATRSRLVWGGVAERGATNDGQQMLNQKDYPVSPL